MGYYQQDFKFLSVRHDEYIYIKLYDNLILIRFDNLFVFSDSVALILILLKNFCNKIFTVMSDADFIFQKFSYKFTLN